MTIRLDTYDLEVNPKLNLETDKNPLPYIKIEKVYKCLRGKFKKNLNIKLEGQSHNLFQCQQFN